MAYISNGLRLIVSAAVLAGAVAAQLRVTLPEATARLGTDNAPALEGQSLSVSGVVATLPVALPSYTHMTIQDEAGSGLTIEGSAEQFRGLRPGQKVRITGLLIASAGMPALQPNSIDVVGEASVPAPQRLTVAGLNDVANIGRYAVVEAAVRYSSQNGGGDVLTLEEKGKSVFVFLPFNGRSRDPVFLKYNPGDRVRVTGVSAQYCPSPPYTRGFELIVANTSAVVLVRKAQFISPVLFTWGLLVFVCVLASWWWRARKLAQQRRGLRGIMVVAEDIISASSPADIARRLENVPPEVLYGATVEVYLYSEASESLELIQTDKSRTSPSVPLCAPIGSRQALAAVCFRNRTLLAVPNLRRSPLINAVDGDLPACAVIAPMLTQGNILGVIALLYKRRPAVSHDFQAAVQHLANQVAASMKLQERQLMKEQLLRSEKMAAAGQLISGVAHDLRLPLANISRCCHALLDNGAEQFPVELREMSAEAARGLQLVDHLVSFSNMEQREPKPLDIHSLLSDLLEIRKEERKRRGLALETKIPLHPADVLADKGQLEQALLTVIVQAEHAASSAPDRTIRVEARIVGARVQCAFESTPQATAAAEETALADYFGFPVAQAIFQSHGGDLRNASADGTPARVSFQLPLRAAAAAFESPRNFDKPGRVLTGLILEPDLISQRRLLAMFAARGHRAVPAITAEEAADLVQRMNFDVLFCATRISGLTWVELYHRVRRRVGVFALLTDGLDAEPAQMFAEGEGQLLEKPVEERDLDRIIGLVEVRWAASRG
ncbi:MAG: hybrid sensor histidine kinase/response regulator [Bryobacteraceae bacterium]|nr:hybrid sensor histidine kinase/response regulator [Bryobacteraceae bacterium]